MEIVLLMIRSVFHEVTINFLNNLNPGCAKCAVEEVEDNLYNLRITNLISEFRKTIIDNHRDYCTILKIITNPFVDNFAIKLFFAK